MVKLHIAVLMMVKNEKKRLGVTLESIKNFADSLIIYDTGSTDNTINILKQFSEKNNIPLRLKEGEFVNFSTSRNVSLDFADTFDEVDYILLLDVNDELRNCDKLRKFAREMHDKPNTGFLVCQEWWSGRYDKYYNMRFVKAHKGWRYKGSVHEYMEDTSKVKPAVLRIPDDIVIFQDRTQDDDKTGKRFKRDKILLYDDYKKDPTEPRTLFYLAQTCSCLNHIEEAFYYYKIRSSLEGFQEEKFHSFLRSGELAQKLGHPWHDVMGWYMKAYEHSPRAEPLVYIVEYYNHVKNWWLAYTFARLACMLSYPDHCILFVDKHAYDYKRWHLMSLVAYYAGFYVEGKTACEKAIACGLNSDIDAKNMKFYIEKEQENNGKNMTKKKFINNQISVLSKKYPKLKQKQILSKANTLWKNRNKKA
jgi:glycosyltransferase involved in cell wall biosynthesis